MVSVSEEKIIDFIIKSQQGELIQKEGKQTQKLKIGDKAYRYNKNKPASKVLNTRLKEVARSDGYRKHSLLMKGASFIKLTRGRPLQDYVKRFKSKITDEQQAFKGYTNTYSVSDIRLKGMKGLSYLKYQKQRMVEFLNRNPNMKIIVEVDLALKNTDNEEIRRKLRSRRYNVHNPEEINSVLNNIAHDIEVQIEIAEFTQSGLVLLQVGRLVISYDRYNPTRGSSYIPLPDWVANKKACINIKNNDELCFNYSVQCGFYEIHKKDHPCDMYHYKKYVNDSFIKWDNINFPVGNDEIEQFEEQNKHISVNVYYINPDTNSKTILLYKRSNNSQAQQKIDLIKLTGENGNSHYVYIKNYNKLMGSQTNKTNRKKHHCRTCSHGFKSEELLKQHEEQGCLAVEGQEIKMPEVGATIEFKNHFKKLKAPYVIYADFECLTVPIDVKSKSTKATTTSYQNHRPCGFMINVVNAITGSSEPYLYRGEDCMDKFVEKMNEVRDDVMKKMKEVKEIIMTEDDKTDFDTATKCFVCGKGFQEGDKKVRDHCHFTGKYRGCAHDDCNLAFSMRYYKIPVFLHNLKNYDAHLIINKAHELSKNAKIDCVAQNSEKFITFGFKNLCFKDSFSFLSSSLDKLVKLSKYEDDKRRENWKNNFRYSVRNPYVKTDEDLDLLTDKGIYPYDYFDSFDRFTERNLPSKEAFYSKLSEEHVNDKDYERAQKVWKHFGIRTLGQYHDLYLRTDVLLLTDVFENFRDLCMEYYGLDPAHYYTLPNFAWEAMLLKTGVEIEQLHDKEMYEMVEQGMRGGMCQVSHKLAEANNKYMDEAFDESKPSSYINYLDANNLYGLAMSQKLPLKNIKWAKKTPNIEKWDEKDEYGYIMEVDLEYPETLHDYHSDYPLAPEIMNVNANMLSDYQKEIFKIYYGNKEPKDEKTSKLILNLKDKEKYVVHIKTLQYYLKMGMKLTKVHRIIKFQQRAWLKPWIDFNTGKRKEAKSDFEKDLFKLMNNAVYGKTMEDKRKHMDFELVDNDVRYEKCVNNPTFKNRFIINENLVGVEKTKSVLKLDKPIFLGMTILDLSKLHMYEFYYGVLKKKYNENIKLIYTDTDSYVIQTFTDDIYKDFQGIKQHMDFSDYPVEHPCHDTTNKKVLGMYKDEVTGKIITRFIGLKPKSYAFTIHGEDEEHKKSKGVVKHKVKKELTYQNYHEALHHNKKHEISYNFIRSRTHQIYSMSQVKQSLSNYENKRFYIDAFNSIPYGHFSIK